MKYGNIRKLTMGGMIDTYASVQEVVEKCLGYVWYQICDEGDFLEMLSEEIGVDADQIVDVFHKLDYTEEEKVEEEFEDEEE